MTLADLRVFYLHGFGSGPGSRKAQFFSEKLQGLGIRIEIPDLNEGDFPHLTLTRQLHQLENLLARQPAVLIGSSLGGYLAALYASLHAEVARLLLLAPAFDFCTLWTRQLGAERVEQWRARGTMLVFNYAAGAEMPLHFEFLKDTRDHPPYPDFVQPALIVHGEHDPTVPIAHSIHFQAGHPARRLLRLNSGHELTDALDKIWAEAQSFLFPGVLQAVLNLKA